MLGKGLESLIPSGVKKPDTVQDQADFVSQDYSSPKPETTQPAANLYNSQSYVYQTVKEPIRSNEEPVLKSQDYYQAPSVGAGMAAFIQGDSQSVYNYPSQPSAASQPAIQPIGQIVPENTFYKPENAFRNDFYQEPASYTTSNNSESLSVNQIYKPYEAPVPAYPPISQPINPKTEELKPATILANEIAALPAFKPLNPSAVSPYVEEQRKEVLATDRETDYSVSQGSVFQIEVDKIVPNPHQPRRYFDEAALTDLANSIREFGIIQPLVVTKVIQPTESGENVTYQLIAGERRLQAAKRVGLRTVPVVIKQISMDRERLELAIIENVQREDLNPLETARSYARLQDEFGLTQREIAVRMGKSRETVANTLRLLNLSTEIQKAIESGKINESHARVLLQVSDPKQQQEMFESILRFKPTVRELKAKVRHGKIGVNRDFGFGSMNPELIAFQSRLEEVLGTKVQIVDDGDKGKITINYYSPEELSDLINRLSGNREY